MGRRVMGDQREQARRCLVDRHFLKVLGAEEGAEAFAHIAIGNSAMLQRFQDHIAQIIAGATDERNRAFRLEWVGFAGRRLDLT